MTSFKIISLSSKRGLTRRNHSIGIVFNFFIRGFFCLCLSFFAVLFQLFLFWFFLALCVILYSFLFFQLFELLILFFPLSVFLVSFSFSFSSHWFVFCFLLGFIFPFFFFFFFHPFPFVFFFFFFSNICRYLVPKGFGVISGDDPESNLAPLVFVLYLLF